MVQIALGYADGGDLTNTAAIATTATTDPVAANDSATEPHHGQPLGPTSRSTKTAASDPVIAGTNETYTVKVTNLGPSDNAGFTLTDAVPGRHDLRVGSSARLRRWRPARSPAPAPA